MAPIAALWCGALVCWLAAAEPRVAQHLSESGADDPVDYSANSPRPTLSLAIIGAGIGGSTAAYFLSQSLRELGVTDALIDVYEANDRVGGRTNSFEYKGELYETGASIVYSGNMYVANLTTAMNLTKVPPPSADGGGMGLWDGKEFAISTGKSSVMNALTMLWRYRRTLFAVQRLVWDALLKFDGIYGLQSEGRAFETPETLWAALGLYNLTQVSIADHVAHHLGRSGTAIERELVFAVNKVNYNQGNEVNALTGLISLCPAVTGDLFRVEGGNRRLSERLLEASEAKVHLDSRVTLVQAHDHGGISVHTAAGRADPRYDAVIVAEPLSVSPLAFRISGRAEKPQLPDQPYQTTHTTFLEGVLEAGFFNMKGRKVPPSVMMTREGAAKESFSSLALYKRVGERAEGSVGVFKMFSSEELTVNLLDRLFVPGTWQVLHHTEWKAYPKLSPLQAFAPAVLFPGQPIYYVNALEGGVSALEISVIAAKNAVLLLLARWQALRGEMEPHGDPAHSHSKSEENPSTRDLSPL